MGAGGAILPHPSAGLPPLPRMTQTKVTTVSPQLLLLAHECPSHPISLVALSPRSSSDKGGALPGPGQQASTCLPRGPRGEESGVVEGHTRPGLPRASAWAKWPVQAGAHFQGRSGKTELSGHRLLPPLPVLTSRPGERTTLEWLCLRLMPHRAQGSPQTAGRRARAGISRHSPRPPGYCSQRPWPWRSCWGVGVPPAGRRQTLLLPSQG